MAVDRPRHERAAVVAAACRGDDRLRRDVESLLARHDTGTLATGPDDLASALGRLRRTTLVHRHQDEAAIETRMASHLESRAARRLELVCIATIIGLLVLWLGVNALRGELSREFASIYQWAPPAAAVVASWAMLWVARTRRVEPTALVRLGLVYEVVVSGALTGAAYFGAFAGLSADAIWLDRVGLSYVAPWTLFFTVLVPARPREALVALVASASAVPLVYLQQVLVGLAPALPLTQFLPTFVIPYVVGVGVSYVAARVVHQLGVEVRRAQALGAYRLEARLGVGGMGEVWRASHSLLARPAAIKLIRRDVFGRDPVTTRAAIARFEREAQAIASLQSPHTIELYDFGTTEDGGLFYAMELLDGIDLEAMVRRFGPMPPARVVSLLRQVCASLAEAHARGLVHRDIKPANIYVCRRGLEYDIAKVLDFGLVKHLHDVARPDAPVRARDAIAGTPGFMAPEAIVRPAEIDARTDLYAVGCVAYFLLTGQMVFAGERAADLLNAHVTRVPVAPGTLAPGSIPDALDRLVLACLAQDPAERPVSAAALSAQLAALDLAVWTDADAERWWAEHLA